MCSVRGTVGWAKLSISRTTLNQSQLYTAPRSIKLSFVPEALNQGELCPGQSWFKLSLVRDCAESSWAMSGTVLSQAGLCPRQGWVKFSSVPESAESSWTMSRTALNRAELCFNSDKSSLWWYTVLSRYIVSIMSVRVCLKKSEQYMYSTAYGVFVF